MRPAALARSNRAGKRDLNGGVHDNGDDINHRPVAYHPPEGLCGICSHGRNQAHYKLRVCVILRGGSNSVGAGATWYFNAARLIRHEHHRPKCAAKPRAANAQMSGVVAGRNAEGINSGESGAEDASNDVK